MPWALHHPFACLAVALVIAFPALVMHYKGAAGQIDPSKIQIEIPQLDMPAPPLDFGPPARPQGHVPEVVWILFLVYLLIAFVR